MIEHRQAEEDRSFLAAIVDSSDDAIIGKTLDGIITIWNRGAQELYGYSAEEAVGESVSILVPPERSDEVPRNLERVRQGEKVERYETVRVTKTGQRLDISQTVSPINDSEGNVVGASTIARDITERKKAEQRLAAQHAVTCILAESATLGAAAPRILRALCECLRWEFGELWSLDRQDGALRCVRTWGVPSVDVGQFDEVTRERIFSRGQGLPGRVWESGEPAWVTDVIEDTNFPRVSAAAKVGLRGAVAFPILLGGEVLGVLGFYSQEIRQPDEEVFQMMSTIGSQIGQFIERKQAEEERERLSRQSELILSSAGEGIFGLDRQGRTRFANPAAAAMLGYEPEEFIGRYLHDLIHHSHPDGSIYPREECPIYMALQDGAVHHANDEVFWRKDGTSFPIEYTSAPIHENEEVTGTVVIFSEITERKKAQETLRESEEFFRALYEDAHHPIFILNKDLDVVDVNPYACEFYGYSREEFKRMKLPDITLSEERDNQQEDVEKLRQQGKVFVLERRHRKKNGEVVTVTADATRVIRSGQELYVNKITDITKRKQAEDTLRESGLRYRSLVELSPDAIVVHTDGKLVYVNTAGAKLLGADLPSRIIGKHALDFIHPDYRAIARERVRLVLAQGKQVEPAEEKIVCLDGRVMDAEVSGSFILYQGKPSVQNVIRDITERKEAEKEKARQARYAALRADVNAALAEGGTLQSTLRRCTQAIVRHLDTALARIWTLDEKENVLELQASAGMYAHLDGEHSRVPVGKFKIGLIAQERLPRLSNDVLDDPRVHDKEWARREGMVAFAGYPLIVEDRLVGVLATFAREQLAEATLSALASVAGTIAQGIVRKRAEESLKAYAARLNQSNRDLQDFAYVSSHDLQEPLRKVRTFADRLNAKYREVLDEQGRDYLERMEGAAARMQNLIDDLLELSRVTTKAQPFTSVDLNEVARDVVSDLEARIDQVGGRVEVNALPTIEADRLQMRQLLQNLIGNALKFHREKEAPVVKVYGRLLQRREEELSGGAADSRVCQILVEDNGIGFDEKHLERVFAPFHRLRSRAAYEGTGMGLPICRKVVERHGGNITAKSAPGQGATFIVTLPVKQAKGTP